MGDRLRGGVRPVRGTEGVVHVQVGERREPARVRRIVLRLARLEPRVLEQRDAPARLAERDLLPEQLGEATGDRLQRVARVGPVRASQMRAEHEL